MTSLFPSDPFDLSNELRNSKLLGEYNKCTTIYDIIIPTYDYIIINSILYTLIDEIYKIIIILLIIKYNYWILYKKQNKLPQNLVNDMIYSSSRLSQTSTSSSLELGVINNNDQNSSKIYPISATNDIDISFIDNTDGDLYFTDIQIKSSILRQVLEEYKYCQINWYLLQQIICNFFIILYSLSTIHYDKSNVWISYIKFYGFITNSSVINLFISSIWEFYLIKQQKLLNSNDPRSYNYRSIMITKIAILLSSLFLLPIIITHIIPMFVVYIWVVFCYALVIMLVAVCFTCLHVITGYIIGFILLKFANAILYCSDIKIDYNSTYYEEYQERIIKFWFYKTFFHFSLQLLFVVLYNYGSLIYTTNNLDESKYFGIIGVDYIAHTNVSCFYKYSYDISFKGLLVFIQFII